MVVLEQLPAAKHDRILEKVQLVQLHNVVYLIVTWVQLPINTEMASIAQLLTNIFYSVLTMRKKMNDSQAEICLYEK